MSRFRCVSSLALCALVTVPAAVVAKAAKPAAPQPAAEKKWDVDNPGGPSTDVALDVREGTWLSLDVAPDGQEIAFDLLGDLYTLPIAGGEAKALTAGVAWDMQPRYSPDGKTIAFTSDRAGGDNIWLVDRDGKNPRTVTKESFRLLNSPVWLPDGSMLAARKHFTAERSLGSGEIWLYHRTGGDGLQMTSKPNDQKDVGEPAFSPDGRYLYFSQDATPGAFFLYNKDSNAGIYVIKRLDRQTGEVEVFLSGAGGAIRPTPSPDGKSLAFIRRVRGKSVLYLVDLASRAERPLYDGLDRDLQETWAIHGVYPTMAWTPDGTSIIFWAGGKIQRLDVASGAVADIPFHVKASRRVAKALHFEQAAFAPQVDTKMLRWVEVSPQGDRVVFQALGHLYVRSLPDGEPHRLTTAEDHFEFYPSFSRDGQWIVYTTWNDATLGSVRVVAASGGEGKVLSDRPGHYIEPAISPDGKNVVFSRIAGGGIRTPTWSQETGLYVVPTAGGTPRRLRKEGGSAPHFGAEPDRVYFLEYVDGGRRELRSLGLDGTEERTHLASDNATEFRVSPDGRWVAFTERFNAYIAPFVATGKTVEIGPKASSVPLTRVSRDAGEYLHWAGDSSALHWSLGPELYTRELKDAFAFLPGAPEKLPEPASGGRKIGLVVPADVPTGSVALVGGRVITMKGDEVIDDGTVLVRENRIVAVGPRSDVTVPADAKVIDVHGKTVMPGLIDVHWHGSQGSDEIIPQQNWFNFAALGFGVTTIHDPSNDTSEIFSAAEMQRAGLITGPRIFSTGTILYGAKAPFKAEIDSLDDARAHLRRLQAVGAFSVKSYNQPRRDQRQQVIAAARELGMLVVPEGGSLFEHNMTQVVDGHTGVEHTIPIGRIYEDVKQLWSGTEVGYTPTLIVAYGGLWGEEYWYAKTNVWENQRLLSFVPREAIDARSRRRETAPDEEWNHFNQAKVAADLEHRGVKVNIGAHGQREGLGAHWELWMMAQGGMTNHEALRVATLNGAHYLGMDHDLGSLEAGKLADVIVIDGNPLADIRSSQNVVYTLANGRLYDAATMNQIGNHPAERKPLWWQTAATAASTGAVGAAHTDD